MDNITNSECLDRIQVTDVPTGWSHVVVYCREQYQYEYVGANNPIVTTLSGTCQELFFKGPDGVYHCLPTTKFTRTTTDKPPLFAW